MRCYNGAPDSELSAYIKRQLAARLRLPIGTRCVYFPMEDKYAVFNESHRQIGSFEDTPELACDKAVSVLGETK